MAMCFILEWKTGLEHMYLASMLSQKMVGRFGLKTCISSKRDLSQSTLEVAAATALYSASVKDLATKYCLREHYEIAFDPRKTTYALVDVRSSWLPAQSTSEKAWRDGGELRQISSPWLAMPRR